MSTAATITTRHGATYTVRQICADPKRYVAFSELTNEPLHRDGRTLTGAMSTIAASVEHAEQIVGVVSELFKARA